MEPITRDLEIQLQAPFLLYKNAKCMQFAIFCFINIKNNVLTARLVIVAITGVWFYEESECTRIAQKLEALVKEETRRRRSNAPQEKSSVDILSLLTKAHGEYEQVSLYLTVALNQTITRFCLS